jgi:hypothetical protein
MGHPLERIAEDEPKKLALKHKGLFLREKEKEVQNANTARMPNPMFPVSRRELAPSTQDI